MSSTRGKIVLNWQALESFEKAQLLGSCGGDFSLAVRDINLFTPLLLGDVSVAGDASVQGHWMKEAVSGAVLR